MGNRQPIRRAGVIGAGVMGAGIAAHLANAGVRVRLLDIVPPDLSDAEKQNPAARNRFAAGGLDKALKSRPASFFHPSVASLVTVGNVEDHIETLGDCDLVIEAIIEKLEPKQALFARLEKVLPEHVIVASNTSGLPIARMLEGRTESLKKRFLVMHFFNPVRYMKLLELVSGQETAPEVVERVRRFGEDVLGKGIVMAKDTPNFVGNRIGAHSMMVTIHQMLADGLTPEDVDAITGPPLAHPKSASFRTADLVGLDTFVHVADNCYQALTNDEDREVFEVPPFIRQMIEKRILGDKTRGGFYKKKGDDISVIVPSTLEYRPKGGDEGIRKVTKDIAKLGDPRERVRRIIADESKAGQFAWSVLERVLPYAARRVGEITDSVEAIDDAMRWGYSWELGPFETWDALGFRETAERMKNEGVSLPASIERMLASGASGFYTDDGRVFDLLRGEYVAREIDPRTHGLSVLRRGDQAVLDNDGASAWDLGDGVLGLTFKTKANSIDADVIEMLHQAVDKAETEFEALVVFNEGEHFSVGANLFAIVMAANGKQWDAIGEMVRRYQGATQRLRYARVPTVAAPYGRTLGGGLELCFGCDAVQAAAETYAGLVEVGVGLIPGGAGTMNMLFRSLESIPEGVHANVLEHVTQVFKNIALAKVATSAYEGVRLGYFRGTDGVSFDRARQLTEAKARALGLARAGYHAPLPRQFELPGESGIATLSMMVDTLVAGGYATAHDAVIARKLAHVLSGGVAGSGHPVTEDEMLDLEREAFLSLCGEPKSLERMQYLLMNNKPLRN